MINIITIDPSLISTALVINDKKFNYIQNSTAHNKSGLKKWFKDFEQLIVYKFLDYSKFDTYSKTEINKHMIYDNVTSQIIEDILLNIDKNERIIIGIEGFSYSSVSGPLIDLVTFSTLLRNKLLKITKDVYIFSPSTLKLEACKLTYAPIDIGKKKPKLEWRNNEGIAGGSFTKHDICKALIENNNLTCRWVNTLREMKHEILEAKTINKPIEDVNDSKILYEILLNWYNLGILDKKLLEL